MGYCDENGCAPSYAGRQALDAAVDDKVERNKARNKGKKTRRNKKTLSSRIGKRGPTTPRLREPKGPTSTRDLAGKVGDWLIDPLGLYLIREDYEDFLLVTKVTKALDTRVQLDGVIEGTRENSLDPYAIMRTMYLQRRARQIANEESEDTSIYDIDIDIMLLD